jgi:hypothetical protein
MGAIRKIATRSHIQATMTASATMAAVIALTLAQQVTPAQPTFVGPQLCKK